LKRRYKEKQRYNNDIPIEKAVKYDPEKFIESENKEQPKRRQEAPDETDFAVGQAKLDAMKDRSGAGREFLRNYGGKVDELISNLKAGRDPNQAVGSSANRQNYI
tara:strand:- start:1163 stop:1477 length:315 start_codon:yes stop_codon:yes gene_type:complete